MDKGKYWKPSALSVDHIHALGKSAYNVLTEYIQTFGAEQLFIVTNGSKHWVLDSLKQISQKYQAFFDNDDEDERCGEDYFAAIYNSLIAREISTVSAQYQYAGRFPQVKLILGHFDQFTKFKMYVSDCVLIMTL